MNQGAHLYHHGVKGMKWGKRKSKASSGKKISRKQYRSTVKANKKIMRTNKQALLFGNDKEYNQAKKSNREAFNAINEARVERGKKKVKSIMYNLPGALV